MYPVTPATLRIRRLAKAVLIRANSKAAVVRNSGPQQVPSWDLVATFVAADRAGFPVDGHRLNVIEFRRADLSTCCRTQYARLAR